ncbi:MAG TPA: M48 family metallopeptidase [Xanthomonadales bacterium]|nr:M48 family metallopeptidase [Xanthomonadales bacterium]
MRRSITLLFLLSCLLAACATSPTGRKQLMLVSEDSAIASSAQAYVQQVGELKKDGKLSSDRELINRVNIITGRLVSQAVAMRPATAKWQWSVAVIDDPETVNAWCMAGGRMAIYSGMINQIKPTDDELAQVMGHEISHALANHTAEKMSVAMASSLGVLAVGVAVDNNRGAAMAGAAAAAALAVNLPNSRAAENEADRIGIELAARAGYEPQASVTLWRKMNALSKSRMPQFLSTHPNPENREKTLAALVPQMNAYYQPLAEHTVYPVTIVTALN